MVTYIIVFCLRNYYFQKNTYINSRDINIKFAMTPFDRLHGDANMGWKENNT